MMATHRIRIYMVLLALVHGLKVAEPPSVHRAIPNILHMNWKKDLLMEGSSELTGKERGMLTNLENTRAIYDKGTWGGLEVDFASDARCSRLVRKAHSEELGQIFDKRKKDLRTSDICRLAQVYLRGGYYMDNDMLSVRDLRNIAPPNTTLLVVQTWLGNPMEGKDKTREAEAGAGPVILPKKTSMHLFNSLFGATPRHPVIKRALDRTLDFFTQSEGSDWGKFSYAFFSFTEAVTFWVSPEDKKGAWHFGANQWEGSRELLYVLHETSKEDLYQHNLPPCTPHWCYGAWKVGDVPTNQLVFMSRIAQLSRVEAES